MAVTKQQTCRSTKTKKFHLDLLKIRRYSKGPLRIWLLKLFMRSVVKTGPLVYYSFRDPRSQTPTLRNVIYYSPYFNFILLIRSDQYPEYLNFSALHSLPAFNRFQDDLFLLYGPLFSRSYFFQLIFLTWIRGLYKIYCVGTSWKIELITALCNANRAM